MSVPVRHAKLNRQPLLSRNGRVQYRKCPTGAADVVSEIRRIWARRRSNTLELAQVVYAARQKLHYGQWTHLIKSRRIPVAKRTAEMLVAIARSLGDLDAQSYAYLPSALNTLYLLAQLEPVMLENLIAEGVVHPALLMSEARELMARYRSPRNGIRRKLQVKQRLARFREFVRTTFREWMPDERTQVQSELGKLLEVASSPFVSNHPPSPRFKETAL